MTTCFVVQGFGVKTDFATGRTLDLDASYEIIRDAVEDAGIQCIRADEVQHSGVIDRPMYEQLLNADLVIADVSTSNLNAAYELGVRHALRPRTTIIVAEDQFRYPFDISHSTIRKYKHLGEDIGRREARRFRQELAASIRAIMAGDDVDSPLYTYISELVPPSLAKVVAARGAAVAAEAATQAEEDGMAFMLARFRSAKKASDWETAKAFLKEMRKERPDDAYFAQQQALATYKEKEKKKAPVAERVQALEEAREILETLQPHTSHDTETIGLWGAVHKRLWDAEPGTDRHLEEGLAAHARGFALKADYYNGINYAYLLNVRAGRAGDVADAITDWVTAQRIRRQVVQVCAAQLQAVSAAPGSGDDTGELLADDDYWLPATLWEAHLGLGEAEAATRWETATRAAARSKDGWMLESTESQIAKLQALLADSPLRHLPPE